MCVLMLKKVCGDIYISQPPISNKKPQMLSGNLCFYSFSVHKHANNCLSSIFLPQTSSVQLKMKGSCLQNSNLRLFFFNIKDLEQEGSNSVL